jgi:hypothetical protein
MMTVDERAVLHPFERAALGRAPFRYAGYSENAVKVGDEVRPGGSCDYCSAAIRHQFHVRSADGRTFKVGCDCVEKLGRADNRLVSEVERKVKALAREANRARTVARKARESDRVEAAFARLADPLATERLAAMSHPRGFKDRDTGYPLSAAEYVRWMRLHSGHAGRLDLAKWIEKNLT